MAELIQTYSEVVRDSNGDEFVASAHGEEREDGTWGGVVRVPPRRRRGRHATDGARDYAARPRRAALLGLRTRTRLPRRRFRERRVTSAADLNFRETKS
jgi:hypothetical protein